VTFISFLKTPFLNTATAATEEEESDLHQHFPARRRLTVWNTQRTFNAGANWTMCWHWQPAGLLYMYVA